MVKRVRASGVTHSDQYEELARPGPDAAIAKAEEDLFEASPLATHILRLIEETPKDWPVRIGLFGKWGTGKTSILNLLARLAISRKHHVVYFNPWGETNPQTMLVSLLVKVVEVLNGLGKKLDNGSWLLLQKSKFESIASEVSEAHEITKAATTLIRSLTSSSDPKLKREVSALAADLDSRIIILVDDLDRVDPKLVPALLHSIRETFDFPPLAFVMGFDPEMVTASLSEHHKAFKSGREYLEKILDFTLTIPTPETWKRLQFVNHWIEGSKTSFKFSDFKEVEEHLPATPRQLKALLRSCDALEEEIQRYEPDELNFGLLTRLMIVRAFAHVFLLELAEDDNYESFMLRTSASKREVDKILVGLKTAPEALEQRERILDLLNFRQFASSEYFKLHVLLTERPRFATRKEARFVLDQWPEGDWQASLKSHLGRIDNRTQACTDFFRESIRLYQHELENLASSQLGDVSLTNQASALKACKFLGVLSDEMLEDSLPGVVFRDLIEIHAHWSNFNSREYDIALRQEELRVLENVLVRSRHHSPYFLALSTFKPWGEDDLHPTDGVYFDNSAKKLLDVALGLSMLELSQLFMQEGYVEKAINERNYTKRFLIFHIESPLWTGTDSPMSQMAQQASVLKEVQLNFMWMFRFIGSSLKSGVPEISRDALITLVKDHAKINLVWNAATVKHLAHRTVGSMRTYKTIVEEEGGLELVAPSWLEPS